MADPDPLLKAYKGILKSAGAGALLVLGMVVVVLLAFMGFVMDFNIEPTGSDTPTMYWFVLPLGFIAVAVCAVYTLSKRRKTKRLTAQETHIRQEVAREQQLGSTIEEKIVNLLAQRGELSLEELADLCRCDTETMLQILRQQMSDGTVRQHVQEGRAWFFLSEINDQTMGDKDQPG